MKLCSFVWRAGDYPRLGIVRGDPAARVVDVHVAASLLNVQAGLRDWAGVPRTMREALEDWERCGPMLRTLGQASAMLDPEKAREGERPAILRLEDVHLTSPVPRPPSFRDFYAFEQHVRTARGHRGLEMVPEWYEIPVFYFSNPAVMCGPEAEVPAPPGCAWLDYELEVGAVIGRAGRDLDPESAEAHVAGYCVLNDWSARDLQRQEMKVGLGPSKGKDFATGLGPWLVTPDELADARAAKGYDLAMTCRRNGAELSRGNWKDVHWSFGEMLAHASRGVMLHPGDVIGSGTVGTGCILELTPEQAGGWLAPGDVLELEIERLGVLRQTVASGPQED
ncbi:MAG TPA: fumarylacetoacetate hydrolase family protein [Candidatus Krumholzibacteria bacterium]|nr:fumarylacetoacetate hydrolase family protein [Candidatus Krumholzibacteria bacterium]HRX51753.1 fumarylacetoacetate hydrolase family protein [Candidatus Krumholzibacteria bacterium]